MTVKLNFNAPLPYSQRSPTIKAMKELGLNFDRIYQDGPYSLLKFFGRFPNVTEVNNVDIILSDKGKADFQMVKDIDYVEIYLMFERKRDYENRNKV